MRRQVTLRHPFLKGEDVKEIQKALGLKGDAADGSYGPDTASAVEEWKWRVGYPKHQINNRLGLLGLAWIFGEEPFPPHFARNAKARKGKPYGSQGGLVRPLPTSPGMRSEFSLADGEGAPDRNGVKHHAGKDWFCARTEPRPCACRGHDRRGEGAAEHERPGVRRHGEDRGRRQQEGLGLPSLRPHERARGPEGSGRSGRRPGDAVAGRRTAPSSGRAGTRTTSTSTWRTR